MSNYTIKSPTNKSRAKILLISLAVLNLRHVYIGGRCAYNPNMDADFCIDALKRVLRMTRCDIFNTDQGSQFTSKGFTDVLNDYRIRISMMAKDGGRIIFLLSGYGAQSNMSVCIYRSGTIPKRLERH